MRRRTVGAIVYLGKDLTNRTSSLLNEAKGARQSLISYYPNFPLFGKVSQRNLVRRPLPLAINRCRVSCRRPALD